MYTTKENNSLRTGGTPQGGIAMMYEGFAMFDADNNIIGERYTDPQLAIDDTLVEFYSTLEDMRNAGVSCKKCLFDYDAKTRTSELLECLDEIEY
jgi:hypothetical protein